MIREDAIFGKLEYNTLWQRKIKYEIFQKEFEIILFIDGEENEEFTEVQRQSYIEFFNNKDYLMTQIEKEIFAYYQSVCSEYRDMYEEDADIYMPVISDKSQLKGLVKPQSITIPRLNNNRTINILFKTKWDLEMGIGIRLINEKITIVGVQSDVL